MFPGIAVARELRNRDGRSRVLFVGSTRSIESAIVEEQGLEHRMLPVEPLTTLKRNPFRFVLQNWRASRQAHRLLRSLQPTAVVGLGGFASAPIVWAASRQRIPVILLEQNVIPGRTTRWLSRFAKHVCVTFAETAARLPRAQSVIVTGNAVRAAIAVLHTLDPISNENSSKPELLILGGSQGADSLNDAVLEAIRQNPELKSSWTFVHQTGPRQVDDVRKTYQELGCSAEVEAFFHDMPKRYSTASLVISRAGATTLAELACAGVAMILLPYPHAADDHQRENALVFVNHGAAVIVEHAATPESTASNLAQVLQQLVSDQEKRRSMGLAAKQLAHPDAAQKIADVIGNTVGRR